MYKSVVLILLKVVQSSPLSDVLMSRTFSSEGKQPPHRSSLLLLPSTTATYLLSVSRGQGVPSSSLPVPTLPPPALHQPRDPLRLKSDPVPPLLRTISGSQSCAIRLPLPQPHWPLSTRSHLEPVSPGLCFPHLSP